MTGGFLCFRVMWGLYLRGLIDTLRYATVRANNDTATSATMNAPSTHGLV